MSASELDQQWAATITKQDARIERLIDMVDSLADKFRSLNGSEALQNALTTAKVSKGLTSNGEPVSPAGHGATSNVKEEIRSLREQVDEMESKMDSNFTYLFSANTRLMCNPALANVAIGSGPPSDVIGMDVEGNDSHHEFNKLSDKMDALQEARDGHHLSLIQVQRQVSDNTHRIESLEGKCHDYFPRIKELALKQTLFQKKFESHQEYIREAMDGIARGEPCILPLFPSSARQDEVGASTEDFKTLAPGTLNKYG